VPKISSMHPELVIRWRDGSTMIAGSWLSGCRGGSGRDAGTADHRGLWSLDDPAGCRPMPVHACYFGRHRALFEHRAALRCSIRQSGGGAAHRMNQRIWIGWFGLKGPE
jgi:hypothetical protein